MKKVISLLLCFGMLCMPFTGFAADYTDKADSLAALGLFRGTDNGYDLDTPLTRAQSVTMLTRLLGQEAKALTMNETTIFTDVPKEHWAAGYVMYCYENNITKGTGDNTFTPERAVTAEEFTALTLRLLGYKAEPETAFDTAVDYMLFGTQFVQELETSDQFLRDHMVYIAYRALKTNCDDGETLSQKLIDQGVITKNDAKKQGVLSPLTENEIDDVIDNLFK